MTNPSSIPREYVPASSTPDSLVGGIAGGIALFAGLLLAVITSVIVPREMSAGGSSTMVRVLTVAFVVLPFAFVMWRFRTSVRSRRWPHLRGGPDGLTILSDRPQSIPWSDIAAVRPTRFGFATQVTNIRGETIARLPIDLRDPLKGSGDDRTTLFDMILADAGDRFAADIRLGVVAIRLRTLRDPATSPGARQASADRAAIAIIAGLIAFGLIAVIAFANLR
jgi:hypothetical protein